MVKAGKFARKGLGMQILGGMTITPAGINDVSKKIWFGPINKNTAAGATMTVNVRGPTWGFTWVDYAEFHSRPHAGTTLGQAGGTVCIIYNHNPTLWLPATLNAAQRCFMFIIGRTGGRS